MLKAFRRIRKKPPSGAEKLESDDVEVSLGSSLSSHSTSDDDGPRADHSPSKFIIRYQTLQSLFVLRR